MSIENMKWLAALLLCTTIVASAAALYYYNQRNIAYEEYQKLSEDLDNLTIMVNIKINYGNGTHIWYNETRVPFASSLLTATEFIVNVNYTKSELGAFVDSINEVQNNDGNYWLWSYYNKEKEEWGFGPVGADRWILHDGDVIAWKYTKF